MSNPNGANMHTEPVSIAEERWQRDAIMRRKARKAAAEAFVNPAADNEDSYTGETIEQ